MKILQIHNSYIYYGGEDSVVNEEAKILKKNGHEVILLLRDNKKELLTLKDKFKTLLNLSYSKDSLKILDQKLLEIGKPDIVHVHNTFPLWSYSIFELLNEKNIPVIMTLHNYRLIWDTLGVWDNNYLNVIKEYMNPDFQKVVAENKKHTTNQMVFKEIRGFMDGVNEGYEKRKKQKEDEQLKKQQFAAYFNNRINTRIEEAKKIWNDAPEACWVDKEVVPLLMKFDFTDQNGVSGKTFCDYYFTPV